jgi:putative DNA primase/helicase
MMEFDCSVILVHHTGVSEEAQHRARGSSAWRGALDIEISIVPGKKDQPLQIVQRKSKDAELAETIYVDLQQVAIPGWLDEDGQPVTSAVVVQAQSTSN